MKVIILLGDGMSDELYSELGNKSPLQAARTPNMDFMARHGRVGLAHTVPDGLPPSRSSATTPALATPAAPRWKPSAWGSRSVRTMLPSA
jgi:2,3-bisphosphoglycerate-independent phosphoglycerate mutase